ncbi:MAG: ferredoxin [bacterium]|nr:ferredoxin [bacterium]
MAEKFTVNREKCVCCGVCVAVCEAGLVLEDDGKAKVIDSGKVEECGGETICPYAAIEEIK